MEKLLLLYFPLNDPLIKDQEKVLEIYLKHNVTTIEVALPAEEPFLDGPVIKDSMKRVREVKTIYDMFDDVRTLKKKYNNLKVQIMSYSAIIRKIGVKEFSNLLKQSNVSYILSPDADDDLLMKLDEQLSDTNISVIRFSPYIINEGNVTSLKNSKGYIFQRSTDGQTGKSQELSPHLKENIRIIRENNIYTPVVIGFGISNKQQVAQALNYNANGVVLGSVLFKHICDDDLDEYLSQFDEFYE